ncbi:hypothetical protein HK102_007175 [Quaeritorhiza haematococci]|nr:hypothetical protein HK102_007175 [Quaeritorhiza haematococci]
MKRIRHPSSKSYSEVLEVLVMHSPTFSTDALQRARDAISTYTKKDKKSWRIWAQDSSKTSFDVMKTVSAPPGTTHIEYVQMLLDYAEEKGIGRKPTLEDANDEMASPPVEYALPSPPVSNVVAVPNPTIRLTNEAGWSRAPITLSAAVAAALAIPSSTPTYPSVGGHSGLPPTPPTPFTPSFDTPTSPDILGQISFPPTPETPSLNTPDHSLLYGSFASLPPSLAASPTSLDRPIPQHIVDFPCYAPTPFSKHIPRIEPDHFPATPGLSFAANTVLFTDEVYAMDSPKTPPFNSILHSIENGTGAEGFDHTIDFVPTQHMGRDFSPVDDSLHEHAFLLGLNLLFPSV